MKLDLFYPAKPYVITQAFGITNPSYNQFGFSKHNGTDFAVDTDKIVRAMCDGEVYEVGFNKGAGNFVRYKTGRVEAEGRTGIVGFMYMHAEKCLVTKGQKIKAGDPLIIAGNTGFSTGPHTHISAYFINELDERIPVGNPETDYCIDFSKYYNGYFSDEATKVINILSTIINLLRKKLGY